MTNSKLSLLSLFLGGLILNPVELNAQERNDKRYSAKQYNKKVVVTPKRTNVVVVPRHRNFNNTLIIRPYGHLYIGYGHYHSDNDAWKW